MTEPVLPAGSRVALRMRVNGVEREGTAEPRMLLVDFIREELGLTGTHIGCEHGLCGACTVLLDGEPVVSCLVLAVQADGAEVETVEGLAAPGEAGSLGPLQQAFRDGHALQCGFCTPGFLMAATALLRRDPHPTRGAVREGIGGNLCRCTGYGAIVDAVMRAASSPDRPPPAAADLQRPPAPGGDR